ncbi:hairpin-inducing protein [Genlisea aurea]|uniref:Hairpin-inducing protein n=1 Tax=Genlisea aurea TaxID=192259 RepID=S8D4D9_9LAMI|nr:hairpin-inducing protein [Genlisea aurea]
MAETRQPYLNGAYYGPAIPPPTKTYHRPGRGGGGCCCNPFTCCCGCVANLICTCIFQILCTVLVLAGILIFVLWLIFRPNVIKFYATDAALTEFSLNGNNLQYNLELNFTIRNPNRRIGVYYDQIQAVALYEGQNFSAIELPAFYQGHKTTDTVAADFVGQTNFLLVGDALSNYGKDSNASAYNIDVKLYIRARLKFWIVKSMTVKPKIECNLDIPLSSNTTAASAAASFGSQRCSFDWR